jgi:hypothetical protein
MLLLRQTNLRPNKGWAALQPETGVVLKGHSWPHLQNVIQTYRKANDLETEPNFERQVHGQVCEALPADEQCLRCRFEGDGGATPRHLRPWRTRTGALKAWAIAAAKTIEAKLTGSNPVTVPAEEARQRAAVCLKCPENLPVANCFGCGELGRLYTGLVEGIRPTDLDSRLETCDICGCSNRVQTHFSSELLDSVRGAQGIPEQSYPEWCWKRKTQPPKL